MPSGFQHEGYKATFAAPDAVEPGDWRRIGSVLCVCTGEAEAGERVVWETFGVFDDAPKASADIFTEGLVVYWDDVEGQLTTTDTGIYGGRAWASAGVGETTALVRLDGLSGRAVSA